MIEHVVAAELMRTDELDLDKVTKKQMMLKYIYYYFLLLASLCLAALLFSSYFTKSEPLR